MIKSMIRLCTVFMFSFTSTAFAQNFTKITIGPLIPDEDCRFLNGVNWIDVDSDGDLDLFMACLLNLNGHVLFENNGDGSFKLAARLSSESLFTAGNSSWGDYDNDGDPDIFITDSFGTLYENNNDGSFALSLFEDVRGGCSWADYDNDGRSEEQTAELQSH